MRFPLSGPALAAGLVLAAASFASPALANSGSAEASAAAEKNVWLDDVLAGSKDLICREPGAASGKSDLPSILRKDAFDMFWFPPNLGLKQIWDRLPREQASIGGAGNRSN